MIDRSDPTIETRRETSHILPADDAASKGWFYDPQLRPMPYHFARYREAIEAGIVAWVHDTRLIEHVIALNISSHCPNCETEVSSADLIAEAVVSWLTSAIEAGEHRKEG